MALEKKKQAKILIFSAPIGSGHTRAAQALKEQFAKRDIAVTVLDIFDFASPKFGKFLLKAYFFILAAIPFFYEMLYRWGNTTSSKALCYLVNKIFLPQVSQIIEAEKPVAVIATHFTPAGVVSLYKEAGQKKIPLFAVVTDYSLHQWWLHNKINAYNVFDKKFFEKFSTIILPEQGLWDLGIPVSEQFFSQETRTKREIRSSLGLPTDNYICLLTGGGEGLLPMEQFIAKWQTEHQKNQRIFFVAICGKNQELKETLAAKNLPWLKTVGYTKNMADYMKAADLMVCKAGGVTVSEALALNLPLVLYQPLPGQECENSTYLVQQSLVYQAESLQKLCRLLRQAVAEKNFFEQIKYVQNHKAKPLAAVNIVQKICEFLKI